MGIYPDLFLKKTLKLDKIECNNIEFPKPNAIGLFLFRGPLNFPSQIQFWGEN